MTKSIRPRRPPVRRVREIRTYGVKGRAGNGAHHAAPLQWSTSDTHTGELHG